MTYICLELILVTKLTFGVFENGRIDKEWSNRNADITEEWEMLCTIVYSALKPKFWSAMIQLEQTLTQGLET